MTWRPADRGDLPLAVLWAAAAALAVVATPWLSWVARALPPCALHSLTGIPCLACGSTRAALALTQGEWMLALALNPLAAGLILVGVAGGFAAPLWVAAKGPLPRALGAAARWRAAAWLALVAQWSYLIATGR
jgi:hypothetical protein